MKITQQFLLAAAFIGLIGCSDAENNNTATEGTTNNSTTISAQGSTEGLNEPLPGVSVSESQAAGSAALNPAHGEPGHRCDIAVGAPLNSAPTQSASTLPHSTTEDAPKPTVMSMPASTPPATSSGAGSGKINPPHGEPGHVCEKPVGQPL